MARSIAGTAVWCCPPKIAPQPTLMLNSCRFSDLISLQLSLGSKQSVIFVGHLRPEALLPGPFVDPGKIRLLRIVDCQQRQEKEGLVGPKTESGIVQSKKIKSGDGTKFLAVMEGMCIVVAGASYTASVVQKSQQIATVASSPAGHFFSRLGDISSWQVPALWAALVINALLRSFQMRSSSNTTKGNWEEKSIKDFTVDQRLGKLEDDVQSVAAIARMLSRHLEKLGVRFRVTRRTLRDPIHETAVLALKTSEVVNALATRDDMLEAELRETRKQLRETQQILVSMQASQEKQLELLVTAMTKNLKAQKALEEQLSRDSTRRLAGKTTKSASTDIGAPVAGKKSVVESRKSNFAETFGILKKSFMKNTETPTKKEVSGAQGVEAGKAQLKKELTGDNQNGRVEVPPLADKPAKTNTSFKPDTSFTKEDFWANTPATTAADLSVEHEVVDYLTSTDRTTDAVTRCSDSPQGSGRLDSFFSGRKNINSYQGPINLSTQDFHNPGFSSIHSQSGEYSSGSGRHRESTLGFGFNWDSANGKDKWSSSEVFPDVGYGGTSQSDVNSLSNLSAGDASSGSTSGSPRHSNWSSTSDWDFTSGSGSPRQSSWYSSLDCSSGAGSPRMGEGIINFVQAGFVDTDFMRDFKDGYVSS